MSIVSQARQSEITCYERAYPPPGYRLGDRRESCMAWHQELTARFGRAVVRHGNEGSISEMFEVIFDAV